MLQNVWAPVRSTSVSASSSSPRSALLLAGGLILILLVLGELVFLRLSVGFLRRTAV
ncbi:MAG TPA: hypothetical protein VI110_06790 [Lapillicoccus sp.]